MSITVLDLRSVVEKESGAIFADPEGGKLPLIQAELLEYAEASTADIMIGKLVEKYIDHRNGLVTEESITALLSELEYTARVSNRIAVEIERRRNQ